MKKVYKNITDVLRLNRFIVLAVVILCLLTSGLSLGLLYHYQKKLLNSAFAIGGDGAIVPLQLVDQQQKREVEALTHIDRFHRLFYGIDGTNYRDHLEKALRLGDASVDAIYRQKRSDGVYNRLLQFSLRQQIEQVEIELDLKSEPYGFRARTLFEVHRGTVTDRYQLDTSGKLINVDRNFPHNPHGLLIIDFYEDSLRKLKPQTK
ncbi:conjugal transfer protein TraK [Muricauda oceani]|uniref:Conjugal transfer protein TraK n=1 Tax=Flagellimonas oceani TaxID=2698672 RepID=A0A6G7J6Q1_9FLAO|nr:conjugal transfer protein TraK [Allomuricauda oceani]MBW8242550.1 conjugal transfer protein TraK [Allomuricauda oceani]QII46309.1 conjugal transfer protein TraK [Allomuricauda oceani]